MRTCTAEGGDGKDTMIILIGGASHTGKTKLAQELLEKYKYPYLCIDHIKMGLIRSGNTSLTPMHSNSELTAYLWPIVRETIKTAIENKQNLIVEGCYMPFDWKKDFGEEYLQEIRHIWLTMSEAYIRENYDDIMGYASVIEKRSEEAEADCNLERFVACNAHFRQQCEINGLDYIVIDKEYKSLSDII